MIEIVENKSETFVKPGLVTGKHTIIFHGPHNELDKIINEIENIIKTHNNINTTIKQ